jgi:environmental stress-induced protein Ves
VKIIRANDRRVTRWKNGGGSTAEIACAPPDGSLETFDWRVSMANVGTDGPFSHFAEIDRTLAVVEGSGLVLTVADRESVTLDTRSDPVHFAGDIEVSARLTAGGIVDLNVMTRRGRFEHDLWRLTQSDQLEVADGETAIVVSIGGDTVLASESGTQTLAHADSVILSRGDGRIALTLSAICYLVRLQALDRNL